MTPDQVRGRLWAQRLKRVFGIDIDKAAGEPICTAVGCREAVGHRVCPMKLARPAAVRITACIEDPEVIEKILTHLDAKGAEPEAGQAATLSGAAPAGAVRLTGVTQR